MSRDIPRPDKLARQMFFVGLLGLPWLWVVNCLYFYDRVYGKLKCFGSTASDHIDDNRDGSAGFLGLIPSEEDDEDIEPDEGLSQDEIQMELCKWVKRSTIGSFVSTAIFTTWLVVFQINRENFGPQWFVYSPGDEVLTGW